MDTSLCRADVSDLSLHHMVSQNRLIPKKLRSHRVSQNALLILTLSSLLIGCGEDEPSPKISEQAGVETQVTAGEVDGLVAGEVASAGTESDSNDNEVWATKPPIDEGTVAGDESPSNGGTEWIDIGLDGLGLRVPTDGEDEDLPTGESICAYEPPMFTLEHPLASIDRGAEERSFTWRGETESAYHLEVAPIAHLTREVTRSADREQLENQEGQARYSSKLDGVVLPTHVNNLPLYERAEEWSTARCYELGPFDQAQGGVLLSEAEAYEVYERLVQTSLWRSIDQSPNKRTIIGIRGAYPGSLRWHHNAPNQYNDSLILLWRDELGQPHVREYPVNTDTGVYDFGVDNSSSLRANRHYPYINGWHRDYNAIQIALPAYPVRDDTNNNGHWDSDRNGWLDGPELGDDYDRLGTAHNIHAGDSDGPLSDALINIASAGCQVIPGMENWLSFISQAWTGLGDDVDYYLIDARDISPRFWASCTEADGSHSCPHLVESFPYTHQGDTSLSSERRHDVYNCSPANESGPELVYVMNLPSSGRIRASITTSDEEVDPDLYLLDGDDMNACRVRDHRQIESWLPPGRYVLIVDTWVNAEGRELSGEYRLNIDWSPED